MKKILTALLVLVGLTGPAFAHLNPAEHGSFAAGFTHPMFGMDHVLVMIAVGLWAFQIGGKAIVNIPLAFVATMVFGFALALIGAPLMFVEPAILASVVALGLLLTFAIKLPLAPAMATVALFALFHGNAHGSELGAATAIFYAIGFSIATAMLHASGIFIGFAISKLLGEKQQLVTTLSRVFGGITALIGLSMFFA